jgi:hypothetical protein
MYVNSHAGNALAAYTPGGLSDELRNLKSAKRPPAWTHVKRTGGTVMFLLIAVYTDNS